MILVDTSVWVDHLRSDNNMLVSLLESGLVLTHPFVIGELALGKLHQRNIVLSALFDLPSANVATGEEVLHCIERYSMFGRGIGYVDVHLLAAVRLTAGSRLWTHDGKLHTIATELSLAMKQSRRN